MGARLVSLIGESSRLRLVGATESKAHPLIGKDVGEIAGYGALGVILQDDLSPLLEKSDVVIDFTTPLATLSHVENVVSHKRAMVVGTTGFSQEELQKFHERAQSLPCVFAPNMSVGINVLLQTIGKMAQALGDGYDIEVVEAHHQKKKDTPSGTALKLAESLATAKGWDLKSAGVFARHGLIGERGKQEIGIQTIRAGDIVGDHTIIFGGLGERIELTHRAHTRDTFARGALRAAEWVITQPPGLYTMAQVLGL